MLTRFDRMYERDRQTDTHRDRQTDGHRMTAKAALDASIARQKSQIAYLDMHHLVFGINFHFVSLISPVSIHLPIHLSTHPCHHRHPCHHTPGSSRQKLLKHSFSQDFSHWSRICIELH